jgi:hypothetical protein
VPKIALEITRASRVLPCRLLVAAATNYGCNSTSQNSPMGFFVERVKVITNVTPNRMMARLSYPNSFNSIYQIYELNTATNTLRTAAGALAYSIAFCLVPRPH